MATIMSNLAPPDDDMEISSDVEHGGDRTDIEVDVDLIDDEDYMIEDSTGDNDMYLAYPNKDDDLMVDDGADDIEAQDGPMADDIDIRDEELLDVPLLNERSANDVGQSEPAVTSNLSTVEITVSTPPNMDQIHNPTSAATPYPSSDPSMNQIRNDVGPQDGNAAVVDATGAPEPQEELSNEIVVSDNEPYVHGQLQSNDDESIRPSPVREDVVSLDNSNPHDDSFRTVEDAKVIGDQEVIHAATAVPVPRSSESNELVDRVHPVVVKYYEEEAYLFRSPDASDARSYFLDDESLVFESLKDILQRCREVLADNMEEHCILELMVPKLDLVINEDSPESGVMTLHEILTLYLQLSDNDGVSNPSPLAVNLVPRFRLTQRWEQLKLWASEGYGLKSLDMTLEDGDVPSSASVEHSGNQVEGAGTETNTEQQGQSLEGTIEGENQILNQEEYEKPSAELGGNQHQPLVLAGVEDEVGNDPVGGEDVGGNDAEGDDVEADDAGDDDAGGDDLGDDEARTLGGSAIDESHAEQADDGFLDSHGSWQEDGDMVREHSASSETVEEIEAPQTQGADEVYEVDEVNAFDDSLVAQHNSGLSAEDAESVSLVGGRIETTADEIDLNDDSEINYEDDEMDRNESANGEDYTRGTDSYEAVFKDGSAPGGYEVGLSTDNAEAAQTGDAAQSHEAYIHIPEGVQPHTNGNEAKKQNGHGSLNIPIDNPPNGTTTASPSSVGGTATGKRSYDAFEDVLDELEPNAKKARPA